MLILFTMTDFEIIYNEHYNDKENVLDMNFLLINNVSKQFFNFGLNLWLNNFKSVYNDYKWFFAGWVKSIDSLLLNEPDSLLYYDGQGSFLADRGFEIKQTVDVNTYNLHASNNYNVDISRKTLQDLREMFQNKLVNIDNILNKKNDD